MALRAVGGHASGAEKKIQESAAELGPPFGQAVDDGAALHPQLPDNHAGCGPPSSSVAEAQRWTGSTHSSAARKWGMK